MVTYKIYTYIYIKLLSLSTSYRKFHPFSSIRYNMKIQSIQFRVQKLIIVFIEYYGMRLFVSLLNRVSKLGTVCRSETDLLSRPVKLRLLNILIKTLPG